MPPLFDEDPDEVYWFDVDFIDGDVLWDPEMCVSSVQMGTDIRFVCGMEKMCFVISVKKSKKYAKRHSISHFIFIILHISGIYLSRHFALR